MTASFDIVDLIENNPITKLSTTYQNKLLTKIKTKFTENEQQIFVASFYGFLNYDSKMDFVIVSKAKSVEGHKNNKFETLQMSCD